MIDKARMMFDKRECGKTDLSRIEYLTNDGKLALDTGELWSRTGRYRNMKVTDTPKNTYITGSWETYYFGNNVQTLTRSQVKLVLEQLSDELQLPLWRATITQLEFAANLAMSEPVGLYLPLLQSFRDYKRNSTDMESVDFWARTKRANRAHELSFYDKLTQCVDIGMRIPPEFEGQNLLRYELGLNKRIP